MVEREEAELHVLGAAVMALTTDVVFLLDPSSLCLVQANDAFTRLLGYEAREVPNLTLYDISLSDRASIAKARDTLLSEGRVFLGARTYRRKDGTVIEMESSAARVNLDGRIVSCVVARDTSERRQADLTLRESEERFRRLADASFEGIAITDTGRFVDANAQMGRLLGLPVERLLGRVVSDFVAPESRELVAKHIASGSEEPYAHMAMRADGSIFPVEVQAKAIPAQGRELRVTAIRDVSQRWSLEEQVRLAQRMESVGRLAGGVAHDFNNLLTVILSSVQLLCEAPLSETDAEDLKQIELAAQRAAELTQQLLAFARRQIVEPKVIDLNAIAASTDKMLRRVIGEDIELATIGAPNLGMIRADPAQVEQVLLNLAVNARDAMPNGGTLTVETGNVMLDDEYARTHPDVKPGEYVMISVSDTGTGIDKATMTHIFEPFFTTKVKGTGLGLATCYGIVKQAGGSIWVYSEPGKGTTFKVYFPRVDERVSLTETPARSQPPRGTETLLVVEDDEMVRQLAIRILRRQGYVVVEASGGPEAIARFDELGGKVDLLLTDVVMLHMSGKTLAEQLLQRKPDLKVLFTSGYTENTIVHHGVVDAGVNFLAKPYVPADLARRVREVLDQKTQARG